MSFANKGRDSKDTAKLRAEYEKKAQEFRDTTDPASKTKLRDEKEKLFERVVQQQTNERRENIASLHKVLVGQGKLKTDAQMKEEAAKLQPRQAAR